MQWMMKTRMASGSDDTPEELRGRVLAMRKLLLGARTHLGTENETTFMIQFDLCKELSRMDPREAIPLLERTLALATTIFGADDVRVCDVSWELATQLDSVGRIAQSAVHWRAAADGFGARLGPHHSTTLHASLQLAWAMRQGNSTKDAGLALMRRVLETARAALGDDDEIRIAALCGLGVMLKNEFGQYDDAETLLQQAFEASRRIHGDSGSITVRWASCPRLPVPWND